jgi:uncharacterized protein YqeY
VIKQQIQDDSKEALKQGNHETLGVLRLALSAISAKEKEKRYALSKKESGLQESEAIERSALSDDEIIDVLSSEVKKRRDAIALYEQGNRPELAEQEKKEITVLQAYLPEQLSPEALASLVQEAIASTGASSQKEMGKIMQELMPKIKGRADTSLVSKLVKELLHG